MHEPSSTEVLSSSETREPSGCHHCGAALGLHSLSILVSGQDVRVCSDACRTAVETIASAGLDAWYGLRTHSDAQGAATADPRHRAELDAWRVPEVEASLLTGESNPVARSAGSRVLAGSVNGSGVVEVEVTSAGDTTVLGGVLRQAEQAARERPAIAQLADRAAAWFIGGMLVLAAGVAKSLSPGLWMARETKSLSSGLWMQPETKSLSPELWMPPEL